MAAENPVLENSLSVLGRASRDDVDAEPFAHIVLDQALPEDNYAVLARDFPPLEAFVGELPEVPDNYAVRLELRQAETAGVATEAWRKFFAYHVSQDFWRDVVRVFGPQLRQAHPNIEERVGRPLEEWRVKQRGAPEEADVALACQFVVNTPTKATTSVKPAHIDRSDKIFAGLFYMRRPDDESQGAGLELYRHRADPIFDKHETPWSSVDRAGRIDFAANRLVGFVNSVQSVHAVEPRTPSSVPRRYINMIAELPDRAFKAPQMGGLRRFYYRNFQRPPRRTIGRED